VQEDLLQYLWRYQKFSHAKLKTTKGVDLQILSPGFLNESVGPDFSNAKIRMDALLWAGPVEVHVNASAWYQHGHHKDANYEAVILHVVWHNDTDICLSNGQAMPTLCLSEYVASAILDQYRAQFLTPKRFIACENALPAFDTSKWLFCKERLYVERLEGQTKHIEYLLQQNTNNWEAVLFQMLAKGVGLNKNGAAFLEMAQSFSFTIIQKCQPNITYLEALFLGQLGLLQGHKDAYQQKLKSEYAFLKSKFKLKKSLENATTFGRLRSANFPTIRLAQLAQLYHIQQGLFEKLMKAQNTKQVRQYFNTATSSYWESHYNFEVKSKTSVKKMTPAFQDLLLVNVVIPLRFAYFKYQGKSHDMKLLQWAREIKAEHNALMNKFRACNLKVKTVLDSQSLLHLKKQYCDAQKCLRCAVGFHIMQKDV